MAKLSKEKLDLLKKSFIDDAMSPGQAAEKVGIAPATANRYYNLWGKEIEQGLEKQLMPKLEASLKKLGKKKRKR